MANKKTTDQIVTVFRLINTAKMTKMEDAEKFALIKAMRQMKSVSADFEDALKDAQERLKPENFDEIAGKGRENQKLTQEESDAIEKYNKDVEECLHDVITKEVELTFTPLTEDALGRFIASNDFNLSQAMFISDVLGAAPESAESEKAE